MDDLSNKESKSKISTPKNLSSLFSDDELKTLFKKLLILIGGVEIFILIMCWLYQLGIKEFDRFGNVNIPFPWKTYFLLSFIVPIAIVFILGILIIAFNKYIYGANVEASISGSSSDGKMNKFQMFLHSIVQIPFLIGLLILGIVAGIIYRIDDVMILLSRIGEESVRLILIILSAALIVGTIFGLVWMVLSYKLKKKNIEYKYKQEVMEKLGLVFTDDNVLVNRYGKFITKVDNSHKKGILPPPSFLKEKDK